MNNKVRNIAFAGAGNVASHLAKALYSQGFRISGIWSRKYEHAQELALECNSVACVDLEGLLHEAELLVVAVPDMVIEQLAGGIARYNGIIVHTAGSVPMNAVKHSEGGYGVFYPLQTFSKNIPVDFLEVPFFLESSSPEVMQALREVASKLSGKVYEADSVQRLMLHIAAVFAGNFSNLMYVVANELLKNSGLPPEVLHPLIITTARKAVGGDPLLMQTGPARRNDTLTLGRHFEALASLPEYADIYSRLSILITEKYT